MVLVYAYIQAQIVWVEVVMTHRRSTISGGVTIMLDTTRRSLLGAAGGLAPASVLSAGARAASFGTPDLPPSGAVNGKNPASLADPGPQNPPIADQFPAASSPPATDVGDMPQFWASFNNAPKRIQNGGGARQVTQADFQISEIIAGVNMRL
jgi:oxalate decarboxylase